MGYSKLDFDRDMAAAISDAWIVAQEREALTPDLVVSQVLSYYVGDKPLKRELQILLDKFRALDSTDKMYKEKSSEDHEVSLHTQEAKFILILLENKLGFIKNSLDWKINVGERSVKRTHEFIEYVQLLIDCM